MENPWTFANWNLTAQGQYVVKHGIIKAQAAAAEAGTTLGGPKPPPAQMVKVIERHWIIQKKGTQAGGTGGSGGGGGGLVGAGSSGSGPPG
jgi:hypothetical protein